MNLLNKMKATNSPPAIAVFATSEVTKDEVVERVASALVLLRISGQLEESHMTAGAESPAKYTHDIVTE